MNRRNKKSLLSFILAIGTGALRQATFFFEKPAVDFVKDVILLIAFFVFLHLAFKPVGKYSVVNLVKTKPLLLISIIVTLTGVGVILQMMLFW